MATLLVEKEREKGSARERMCLTFGRSSLMPSERCLVRQLAMIRNTGRVRQKGDAAFDYLTQHPLNEGEKLSVLP